MPTKPAAQIDKWQRVDFLLQLTNDEIPILAQSNRDLLHSQQDDRTSIIESFVFLAIDGRRRVDPWRAGQHHAQDQPAIPDASRYSFQARRVRVSGRGIAQPRRGVRLHHVEQVVSRSYLLFDWARRLVRHLAILDAVEDVIGPNILVYTTTWFIKEPGTDAFTAWYQDATNDSGCMQFIPRSIESGQLGHKLGMRSSINKAGQFIPGSFEDSELADCCLQPGQFSLHNTLVVHRSGANLSTDRRIGLGISYIPTSVRHVGSARVPAHLVRGEDHYGHFDLDPAPAANFDATAQAVHASSYRRWRDAYTQETARHQQQYLAAE